MEVTIDDVRKFLAENKDDENVKILVKTLIGEKTITPDEVSDFLKTEEGEKLIQPYGDARVTQALKTAEKKWMEDKLEPEVKRRLAAELVKLTPKDDPVSRQLKEMSDKLEESERNRLKDQLKRQVVERAANLKVDPFFIEDFLPPSIEEGDLYLQKIAAHDKIIKEQAINELIASNNFVPNGGKKKTEKIDISKLSKKELTQLEIEGKLDGMIMGNN
ncbi:MAG: hypothetical protein ABFD50_20610 [Smithella sp.]